MSDEQLECEIEDTMDMPSCNAVRAQIRRLIDSGEMKVGEFQKAIGASSVTYSRFMSQNGLYRGSGSSVYPNAAMFFKKRQLHFEKLRIAEGKPKSAKREEMEKIHGITGGVDRNRGGTYITTIGKTPYVDEYGQVRC